MCVSIDFLLLYFYPLRTPKRPLLPRRCLTLFFGTFPPEKYQGPPRCRRGVAFFDPSPYVKREQLTGCTVKGTFLLFLKLSNSLKSITKLLKSGRFLFVLSIDEPFKATICKFYVKTTCFLVYFIQIKPKQHEKLVFYSFVRVLFYKACENPIFVLFYSFVWQTRKLLFYLNGLLFVTIHLSVHSW